MVIRCHNTRNSKMTNDPNNNQTGWLGKGNRKVIALFVGVGIVAGSAFGVQAFAQSKTYAHLKLFTSEKVSEGGGGALQEVSWRGHKRGGHGGFANLSDAEIESKITRFVRHAGIEIDATPEQEAQIVALLTPVALNMKSKRGEMRATGEELHALLSAPTIDRAAVEQLRTEKLAEADQISKEWLDAIVDVAMVLTAEQRQVLEERIEEFRSMRGGWHRR